MSSYTVRAKCHITLQDRETEVFQQQESINVPQNVTVPADTEDQETSDYSNASEVLPNLFYIVRKVYSKVLLLNTPQNFVIPADNEKLEIPGYHSN